MTTKPGDFVLFHFDTRNGLASRPALVIVAHGDEDESCDVQVFAGADLDTQLDLGPTSRDRVPLCLTDKPSAGTYTERE